ncbi:MAG: septal ring lytic transglycosylase RlpA family protein [Thermodesulfobacteria bacterium]|nr:septal ring lytic transglycosylase RlpA family protein [Thermodesulfobacteriota bacterium]
MWGCGPKRHAVKGKYARGTYKPYRVGGHTYYPLPSSKGFVETGYASWYGPNFHGKRTANGERYNMYAMTAAHKILPMNTYVRVENLENNRAVVVRINDRGPFVKNRVIDLSYAAAKKLGIVGKGTARVRLVALGEVKSIHDGTVAFKKTPDFKHGDFYVQVGAFTSKENAFRLRNRLRKYYSGVTVVKGYTNGHYYYKVRVDAPNDYNKAKRLERKLESEGFQRAFLVAR